MTFKDSSPSSSEISEDAIEDPGSGRLLGLFDCIVLPPSSIGGLPLLRQLHAWSLTSLQLIQ